MITRRRGGRSGIMYGSFSRACSIGDEAMVISPRAPLLAQSSWRFWQYLIQFSCQACPRSARLGVWCFSTALEGESKGANSTFDLTSCLLRGQNVSAGAPLILSPRRGRERLTDLVSWAGSMLQRPVEAQYWHEICSTSSAGTPGVGDTDTEP